MRLRAAIILSLASAGPALAQTPSFTLIQPAPGYDQSLVRGMSADGSVVLGQSNLRVDQQNLDSFFWTAGAGRLDFSSSVPGAVPRADARALSANGLVAAGVLPLHLATDHVFRASLAGGYQNIGLMPNRQIDVVNGVSGDGSVIVGYGQNGNSTTTTAAPFRWTAAGGFQDLGTLHPNSTYVVARGVSRDGNVVVGTDEASYVTGPLDAFMWTPQSGMTRLAPAVNSPFSDTEGLGVSGNGQVVFGAGDVGVHTHAWRWTQSTGMVDLGLPAGAVNSAFFLSNYDGSLLIGDMDIGLELDVPIFWTQQSGFQRMSDYLSANGVVLPTGYQSLVVSGLSDDATTFAGNIILQNGTLRGFVVTLPTPGTFACFASALAIACRRRR